MNVHCVFVMLRFGRCKQHALRRQSRLLWKRHDTIVKYLSVTHVRAPSFSLFKVGIDYLAIQTTSQSQIDCTTLPLFMQNDSETFREIPAPIARGRAISLNVFGHLFL